MNDRENSPSHRAAFRLVELLVVIALIAILGALLLRIPLQQTLTSPQPSAFEARPHRLPHPAVDRGDLKVRGKPCQSAFGIRNT